MLWGQKYAVEHGDASFCLAIWRCFGIGLNGGACKDCMCLRNPNRHTLPRDRDLGVYLSVNVRPLGSCSSGFQGCVAGVRMNRSRRYHRSSFELVDRSYNHFHSGIAVPKKKRLRCCRGVPYDWEGALGLNEAY
jgi:hypothetical protein